MKDYIIGIIRSGISRLFSSHDGPAHLFKSNGYLFVGIEE